MSTSDNAEFVTAIRWNGDATTGHLELLDQRLLPLEETWLAFHTASATADAIRDMVVRGAPAIGLTAAYGVVLGAQALGSALSLEALEPALNILAAARPTAVNLHWALDRSSFINEIDVNHVTNYFYY